MRLKYMLVLLVSLLFILGAAPAEPAAENYPPAAGLGPVGGGEAVSAPGAGEFVSRGEFIASLIREAGLNLDHIFFIKAPEVRDVASDVREDAPYARELIIAGHYGVVENGRPYRPGDPVIREEAAGMAVKALYARMGRLTLTQQLIIFGDGDRISPVYTAAVQDAVKLGLFEYGKTFRPGDAMTREEQLALLKAVGSVVGGSKPNPDGVTYSISGDRKSITLYWGEKPTGGYAVYIRSIKTGAGSLKVFYSLRSPGAGEVVTQALTYPRATAELPAGVGSFKEIRLVRWSDSPKVKFYVGQSTFRVDGRDLSMDAAPFLENGRAYVPVRFLAMALGVPEDRISWSPSARAVTMVKGEITLSLAPGGNIMTVNDRSIHMDVAPQLRGGRVYLPARFVAEALGYGVEWDAGEQSVAIGNINQSL